MGKSPHEAGRQDPAASKREERRHDEEDDMVDAQGEQSFPASDPPSWTLGPDKDDADAPEDSG